MHLDLRTGCDETTFLEALYPVEDLEMMWLAGVAIGMVLTGALITLGIICLSLLSSEKGGPPRQRRLLRIYIIVLLISVTGFEVLFFLVANIMAVFHPTLANMEGGVTSDSRFLVLHAFEDFSPVVILSLTDGLFVWRLYTLQNALEHSHSKWKNIYWIFPIWLWAVNLGTGIVAAIINITGLKALGSFFEATFFTSNAILNLYVTLFISIRLLLSRRTAVLALGDKAPPAPYLHIVKILLQSAAINIPMAIIITLGIVFGKNFATAVTPVAGASQALTSVVIIHQVTMERVFSQQGKENTQQMKKRLNHDDGDPENVEIISPLLSKGV